VRSSAIGKRLFEARKRAELTVRALGEAAKVSPSTITEIEQAHHIPRADIIERLAYALRVDPGWLAFGTEEPSAGRSQGEPR
jgi:transcriptional regulator with XRE-family HTH domain